MQRFPFIETKKYLFTAHEKFCIQNPPHAVWLKTCKIFFYCALFSSVVYNPLWTVLEKCTHYLHLQHNTLKNKICINFPNNDISVLTKNRCNSGQKQTDVNSFALRMHFAKTFISTTVNMKIYHRHISSARNITLTSCCSGLTIIGNIN